MFRERSALAGPDVRARFGDSRFHVPVEIRRGSFVAHRAFFTEGFVMAAIRAGSQRLRLVSSPSHLEAGAEWLYDSDGRTLRYRLSERTKDGQVRIMRDDGHEIIVASLQGDQLAIFEIEMQGHSSERLTLKFDDGRFTISLTGAGDLLEGDYEISGSVARSVVRLKPTEPEWAVARAVTVACSQDGPELEFSTTIGE
jgi:hypothetical protein